MTACRKFGEIYQKGEWRVKDRIVSNKTYMAGKDMPISLKKGGYQ